MTKKILALIMALCLVFALAACNNGSNEDETTTAAADTAVNGETVAADETEANTEGSTKAGTEDSTEATTDNTTEAATDNTTEAATQGSTQAAPTKPSTKAEILAYFNTAINKVKPNSKSLTSKYLKNSQAGRAELGNLPGFVQDLANDLIADNMGEDANKKNKTVTSAADKNALFPVEKQSWSSKLGVENIQSATLTESNGSYIITILVKPDAASDNVKFGVGNTPRAFSVVTPQIINENAGPAASLIKNVKTGFRNGKIVATIDAATGNVTAADYHFEWNLQLTAVGIDVSIWFGIDQEFSIAW